MTVAEDIALYFTELGEAGTLDGVAVQGLFEHGYAEEFGVSTREAMFSLATASAASATQASVLVLASGTYRVRSVQADGTGVTKLLLERQP